MIISDDISCLSFDINLFNLINNVPKSTVCIRGNVPVSMLCTGTPDDVKAYCKMLIDIVGKGGGFIMDSSTVIDDAKPENVKTMIAFTKTYGVSR